MSDSYNFNRLAAFDPPQSPASGSAPVLLPCCYSAPALEQPRVPLKVPRYREHLLLGLAAEIAVAPSPLIRPLAGVVRSTSQTSAPGRESYSKGRECVRRLTMDEIRLAVRRLWKRPSTTIASIVTLALAIAAAAATWSIITAVLLKPLQVPDPERLVLVDVTDTGVAGGSRSTTSHWYPHYEAVRDSGIFEQTAAGGTRPLMIGANGAPPAATPVYFATNDFFDVLGVPVLHGRGFQPADDREGAPLVAVLSERFWKRVYGGDANVIGRTLLVGTQTATIVGVAVKGFRGLNLAAAPQVYLPLQTAGALVGPANNLYARPDHPSSPSSWITIVGRLKPEMTNPVAAARVNALLQPPGPAGSAARYGVLDASTAALPATARAGVQQFARLLMGTVGLLVLIGCASVAMLLLIRTEARREEFATCLALGASKRRLAAGVAIEGGMAALIGAALSLPVTAWLFAALSTFQLPGGVNLE